MGKFLDSTGLTKLVELIKGSLPGKATSSTLGLVKPDNSTITVDSDGVLSSSGGSSYTFTNGLTESNGTVSWDLNNRILAGKGTQSVMLGNQSDFNLKYFGNYAVGANQGRATGAYSFASGSGYASGDSSYAEGLGEAKGQYSHAEGWRTVASSAYQHVEGYCNETDSNMIFQSIVGNGTAVNNRINIFTRDWDGNEYLRGNLYVGCNSYGTNANGLTTTNAGGSKVATESYVDTAIANLPSGSSFSGSYNDLTDKPTLFSGSYNDLTNKPTLFSGSYNDLTNKPTLFSGDYNDLSNKPTIPSAYTLPTASTSTLGGVKIDGSTITIDANGVISTGFNLTYDNSTSGLTATTYKTAIDEVVATRIPDALVSTETAPAQNGTINWVYG